jgi:ribosomal protein S18 acetylase RimI-like enzyme
MTSTMIEFRKAIPEDLRQIVDLLQQQLQENSVAVAMEPLRLATLRMIERPGLGQILVAARGDALAGIAVLSFLWTLEHGGATVWLDELYVDPRERRSGLGTKLLEAAMAVARAQGCVALDLEVEPGHEAAVRLYERLGFRRLPRERWMCRLD